MGKPFAGKVPKRKCSQSISVQVNVSGHHLQGITLPLDQDLLKAFRTQCAIALMRMIIPN
ncbi:MAG TPA: hypothetical protein DEA16_00860 [Opitutae bacterium]|jgi:hypothetical protein|nr:hypothetical protein [Opitutae bacterium]